METSPPGSREPDLLRRAIEMSIHERISLWDALAVVREENDRMDDRKIRLVVGNSEYVLEEEGFETSMRARDISWRVLGHLQWVIWVDVCRDNVIAVQMWTMSSERVVQDVKNAFKAESGLAGYDLHLYSHATTLSEPGHLQFEDCGAALEWWLAHQDVRRNIFSIYPDLCALYLDSDETIVFLVRSSKFIAFDRPDYPQSVEGRRVVLKEGSCEMLGASGEAINVERAPGYVGASIGVVSDNRNAQSGTLGAVVETQDGRRYGLTAAHCLHETKSASEYLYSLTFPSQRDWPTSFGLTELRGLPDHCFEGKWCEVNGVSVTIDAALIEAESNFDSGAQSGAIVDWRELVQPKENVFRIFGRTSGTVEDIVFECGTLCDIRRTQHSLYDYGPIYQNQLIISSTLSKCPVEGGDSGSVVWKKTAGELDACGLVIAQTFEGSVPRFGIVTPIEHVLRQLCVVLCGNGDTGSV